MNEYFCDCEDCQEDIETACRFDCDSGYECSGCYEAKIESSEVGFEIDCALGRR